MKQNILFPVVGEGAVVRTTTPSSAKLLRDLFVSSRERSLLAKSNSKYCFRYEIISLQYYFQGNIYSLSKARLFR